MEELVNLFERKTLEFRKNENGEEEAEDTEAHEDDVGLVANASDHVRGNHRDGEVHLLWQLAKFTKVTYLKKTYNPVGTGRDTHTLTTHVEREDFR